MLNMIGAPWYVGKDVVENLGYRNGSRETNRHVDAKGRKRKKNGTDNKMINFENEQFRQVRTICLNGEPWFVAVDVCNTLNINNPTTALSRLDDDERMTLSLSEGHSG